VKRTLAAAAFAVLAGLAPQGFAATVVAQDQYVTSWGASIGLGQTFVWPSDAELGTVRVVSNADIVAAFALYQGVHTCDHAFGEFYSQSNVVLASDTLANVVLSTPQQLARGGTYTFCFFNQAPGGIALHYTVQTSYYAGGTFVSDGTVDPVGGGGDLQFELDDVPPPPPESPARIFMTSVTGTGDLSSWIDAHGLVGLAGADEVCRTRATVASIARAENYIALMSDSNNDAYCRMHGNTGRVYVNGCNAPALPTGAGPWYRMDGLAAMDVSQNSQLFPPNAGYVPRHILYDEFGTPFSADSFWESVAYSGTMPNGVLINPGEVCSDWTSSVGDDASLGTAFAGYGGIWYAGWSCNQSLRLICLEKGAHGGPLPRPKAHTARAAFVTSTTGSGDLSAWADANGATGADAGDNICRAHAARGGLPLAETFKAWLATSASFAQARFQFDGPWFRTDDVQVAGALQELVSGKPQAPIQMDEMGRPVLPLPVWTGTQGNSSLFNQTCSDWSDGTDSSFGFFGNSSVAFSPWSSSYFGDAIGCSYPMALYCFGDNDSIYLNGFQ